jgi:hypothetical protein
VFVLNAAVAFGLNLTMCAATCDRIYSAQCTACSGLRAARTTIAHSLGNSSTLQ